MGEASSRTARRRRSVQNSELLETASVASASAMDNNIPTQEGITLRVLLSRLLNCQPMRVSKVQR